MAQGETITSPDGDRWRVRRRWSTRPVPSFRTQLRKEQSELEHAAYFELFLVFLVVLAGFLIELIGRVFAFLPGLLGRVLLGRPWVVEARDLDDGERSVAYAVKGFRRAGAAVAELEGMIVDGGPPERLSRGERTELPRPGS